MPDGAHADLIRQVLKETLPIEYREVGKSTVEQIIKRNGEIELVRSEGSRFPTGTAKRLVASAVVLLASALSVTDSIVINSIDIKNIDIKTTTPAQLLTEEIIKKLPTQVVNRAPDEPIRGLLLNALAQQLIDRYREFNRNQASALDANRIIKADTQLEKTDNTELLIDTELIDTEQRNKISIDNRRTESDATLFDDLLGYHAQFGEEQFAQTFDTIVEGFLQEKPGDEGVSVNSDALLFDEPLPSPLLKEFTQLKALRERTLDALRRCSDEATRMDYRASAEALNEIHQQISTDELRICVLGGSRSGKSTLLNALLVPGGPTGAFGKVEHTAVPTEYRYGVETSLFAVDEKQNRSEIGTSEIGSNSLKMRSTDPKGSHGSNGLSLQRTGTLPPPRRRDRHEMQPIKVKQGVEYLEAQLPNALCAASLVLLDTPGLSDAYPVERLSKLLTQRRWDGVILMVRSDSMDNQNTLSMIQQAVNEQGLPLFVVVNRLFGERPNPRIRQQALARLLTPETEDLYFVDCLEALSHRSNGTSAFDTSQIGSFETRLSDFLIRERLPRHLSIYMQAVRNILFQLDGEAQSRKAELELSSTLSSTEAYEESIKGIDRAFEFYIQTMNETIPAATRNRVNELFASTNEQIDRRIAQLTLIELVPPSNTVRSIITGIFEYLTDQLQILAEEIEKRIEQADRELSHSIERVLGRYNIEFERFSFLQVNSKSIASAPTPYMLLSNFDRNKDAQADLLGSILGSIVPMMTKAGFTGRFNLYKSSSANPVNRIKTTIKERITEVSTEYTRDFLRTVDSHLQELLSYNKRAQSDLHKDLRRSFETEMADLFNRLQRMSLFTSSLTELDQAVGELERYIQPPKSDDRP